MQQYNLFLRIVYACTTSDVTRCFYSSPDPGTVKLSTFKALKVNIKKSQRKNKLADDSHHSLNYKMSPILKKILSHFINTLNLCLLLGL